MVFPPPWPSWVQYLHDVIFDLWNNLFSTPYSAWYSSATEPLCWWDTASNLLSPFSLTWSTKSTYKWWPVDIVDHAVLDKLVIEGGDGCHGGLSATKKWILATRSYTNEETASTGATLPSIGTSFQKLDLAVRWVLLPNNRTAFFRKDWNNGSANALFISSGFIWVTLEVASNISTAGRLSSRFSRYTYYLPTLFFHPLVVSGPANLTYFCYWGLYLQWLCEWSNSIQPLIVVEVFGSL